jgi:hypothetical protein
MAGIKAGVNGEINNNIQTYGLAGYWDAAYDKSFTPGTTNAHNLASGSLTPTGSLKNNTAFITQPISASCWDFDGVDDYITFNGDLTTMGVAGGTSTGEKSPLTICCWVKIEAYPGSGDHYFIGAKIGSNGPAISIKSNKRIYCWFNSTGMYTEKIDNTGEALDLGNWIHVAYTDNGTNKNIYLNGVLDTTQSPASSQNNLNLTKDIGIGAEGDGDNPFDGQIANALFYNRGLSAADVLQNYNAQKGRFGL